MASPGSCVVVKKMLKKGGWVGQQNVFCCVLACRDAREPGTRGRGGEGGGCGKRERKGVGSSAFRRLSTHHTPLATQCLTQPSSAVISPVKGGGMRPTQARGRSCAGTAFFRAFQLIFRRRALSPCPPPPGRSRARRRAQWSPDEGVRPAEKHQGGEEEVGRWVCPETPRERHHGSQRLVRPSRLLPTPILTRGSWRAGARAERTAARIGEGGRRRGGAQARGTKATECEKGRPSIHSLPLSSQRDTLSRLPRAHIHPFSLHIPMRPGSLVSRSPCGGLPPRPRASARRRLAAGGLAGAGVGCAAMGMMGAAAK